jgi:hypothetical protein
LRQLPCAVGVGSLSLVLVVLLVVQQGHLTVNFRLAHLQLRISQHQPQAITRQAELQPRHTVVGSLFRQA